MPRTSVSLFAFCVPYARLPTMPLNSTIGLSATSRLSIEYAIVVSCRCKIGKNRAAIGALTRGGGAALEEV